MNYALAQVLVTSMTALLQIQCGQGSECVTAGSQANKEYQASRMQETRTLEMKDHIVEIQQAVDKPQPPAEMEPLDLAKKTEAAETVHLAVPFSSQAPDQNWNSPFDEACEETSLIMVNHYLSGSALSKADATGEIKSMTGWQKEKGFGVDTGVHDMAVHAAEYYNRAAYEYYRDDVSVENIKKLLSLGHPVIIPAAGRMLGNPHFQNGGPPYHMLVIVGYEGSDFITHDPGTAYGADYRYNQNKLVDAIHDWTGDKSTVLEGEKAMLVIK